MKLHLLNRSSPNNSSIVVRNDKYSNFLKVWHYHQELEMVQIIKSEGTIFVGDNIDQFSKNSLFLIGENLPHMWLNDAAYFEKSSNLSAEAIAVHFKKGFLGDYFLELTEINAIKTLLSKAKRGIQFVNVAASLHKKIKNLEEKESFERTISFLQILNLLSNHKDYKLLSSPNFNINKLNIKTNNLDKVFEYIFQNFNKKISLDKAASIACMNASSFSRYFKKVNRKTFSKYVNEIRIGFACKLIIENKYNISRICYEVGFNNVSNFNRQFKLIKDKSPSEFQKLHNTF